MTATLADAFFDDPVWSWTIPDRSLRRSRFSRLWAHLISCSIGAGWVFSTSGGDAVAMWDPPGVFVLEEPGASALSDLIDREFGEGADRLRGVLAAFDEHRPTTPHFYLNMLGVRDRSRGLGIGMALLSSNLGLVDEAIMPAYLESSNPRNIERYRSLGFAPHQTFSVAEGGPVVTTMWREPRSVRRL